MLATINALCILPWFSAMEFSFSEFLQNTKLSGYVLVFSLYLGFLIGAVGIAMFIFHRCYEAKFHQCL